MSGYKVERHLLRKHAEQLDDYHENWIRVAQQGIHSSEARVSPPAFTAFGQDFVLALNALVADYTTYIAGVTQSLSMGANNLRLAARTYGMAESEVEDAIKKTSTKPDGPEPGGLEKLLP